MHMQEMIMAENKAAIYWIGVIDRCDICNGKLLKTFVDGRTIRGPWGAMHVKCHAVFGVGLGVGRGQRYEQQENGRWLKVEG
jgi:hypothetical protein